MGQDHAGHTSPTGDHDGRRPRTWSDDDESDAAHARATAGTRSSLLNALDRLTMSTHRTGD